MSALTYIYFDVNKSKVALQVTTTATTAMGVGKIIIGVAQNNAAAGKDATYQVFGGAGGVGTYISGADMIAANIITANEMNVNSLSAITTTTGTLIVDSAGYLRGGQTAYNTGAGFFLGYSTSAYKFSIGDGTLDNSVTWDGTDLYIKGSLFAQQDIFGDGSDSDVTISVDTNLTVDKFYNNLTINSGKTLNPSGFRIFVKGTLTNNGTIARNGIAGSGTTGGDVLASGSLYGALVGANGGAGGEHWGNYTGQIGFTGASLAKGLGSNGSSGGAGGAGAWAAGGAGVGGSVTGTVYNYPRNSVAAYMLYDGLPAGDIIKSNAAAGGGGGGGHGNGGGHGGNGGGAGSGGGIVEIFARTLVNNGSIEAKGGAGADGTVGENYSSLGNHGGSGGGGGGGGGNGGIIILIYASKTGAGTTDITAGAKGIGGIGGQDYYGDYGATGSDGVIGTVGKLIELNV
jgi:hypothetical protein